MKIKFPLFPSMKTMDASRLLSPSALLIVASNLIPIVGVLFWQWDIFVLLVLFWMETAVFAFWAMVWILLGRPGAEGRDDAGILGRMAVVLFFTLHSGLFMLVHFLFLWAMFSGNWRQEIHSPADFFQKIVIAFGIWLPLLISFIGNGISMVMKRRAAANTVAAPIVPEKNKSAEDDSVYGEAVGQLYGRIIVLHLVIIIGAWLSQTLGSMGPFLLLILLKTYVDLSLHARANDTNPPQ